MITPEFPKNETHGSTHDHCHAPDTYTAVGTGVPGHGGIAAQMSGGPHVALAGGRVVVVVVLLVVVLVVVVVVVVVVLEVVVVVVASSWRNTR